MLEPRDPAYFQKVVDFACETGQAEQLFARLLYLHYYADKGACGDMVVELGKDREPASFSLRWLRRTPSGEQVFFMDGGLVYHGPVGGWRLTDGTRLTDAARPGAVRVCAQENPWSVHT